MKSLKFEFLSQVFKLFYLYLSILRFKIKYVKFHRNRLMHEKITKVLKDVNNYRFIAIKFILDIRIFFVLLCVPRYIK